MSDDFKPVELRDKDTFDRFLKEDPPKISELTFTNLFIWEHRYHPRWAQWNNCLLIILNPHGSSPFGLPPVGMGDKSRALDILCDELEKISPEVKICRVWEEFLNKYVDHDRYSYILDRDNSDYVYSSLDLIQLTGRRYHRKKNLLNRFLKNYRFEYRALDMELVECFLDMQEHWCRIKECADKPDLLFEDYAVYKALTHFEELGYKGGAIQIDSGLEAFSLGELLNPVTAVIHIEKANPEITGLYCAINQLFCSNTWPGMEYINREQDLGIEGLRKAKESYYPHHMVNKYTVIPK
ncbi:phosphatidylglycerol lysyltransferase domain-containing protein [Deltaproteobacteria bacterium]|nr:phosphatidylglycerol lysyltransferase domain-containing protein [Deltaproteobacteria bacterium]